MDQDYIVGGFMLLVAGTAGFVAWKFWRRIDLLSWADEAAPGAASRMTGRLVKVDGLARPDGADAPRGPLTDAPCAYWEYELQEDRGLERTRMRTIERQRSEQPFRISDADGSVRVRPGNVLIKGIEKAAQETGESEQGVPRRYIERQVPIDYRVYALGTIVCDHDGTPSLECGSAQAIVSTGTFRRMRVKYAIVGTIAGVIATIALLMVALAVYRLLGGTPLG